MYGSADFQDLEGELDNWMSRFDELTALAGDLMCDDAESAENLEPQLKELHLRWDRFVQVMEEKSKEVVSWPFTQIIFFTQVLHFTWLNK